MEKPGKLENKHEEEQKWESPLLSFSLCSKSAPPWVEEVVGGGCYLHWNPLLIDLPEGKMTRWPMRDGGMETERQTKGGTED